MMYASIDIGEKNFAYCIGCTTSIKTWVHKNIREEATEPAGTEMGHVGVQKNKSPSSTVITSCDNLTKLLTLEKDWEICEAILIEQQVLANTRAQRISQHVWTWFRITYPVKKLVFIPSSLKTQIFLGKNKLSSRERKKWAVDTVYRILVSRNDTKHLDYMAMLPKADDVSDTYLQLLAFVKKTTGEDIPEI